MSPNGWRHLSERGLLRPAASWWTRARSNHAAWRYMANRTESMHGICPLMQWHLDVLPQRPSKCNVNVVLPLAPTMIVPELEVWLVIAADNAKCRRRGDTRTCGRDTGPLLDQTDAGLSKHPPLDAIRSSPFILPMPHDAHSISRCLVGTSRASPLVSHQAFPILARVR